MGQIEASRNCTYGYHVETEIYGSTEMQDFVNCIIEDRQPLVGLNDGYEAVRWAYAATDAVKEKRVVYLD